MSKTFEFEADPFSVLDMWGSTSMILAVKLPGECDEFTRYRVTLTPVEPEPECEPEPLCPVCGKLASEHWDGLWCCMRCGEQPERIKSASAHWVQCSACRLRTANWESADLASDDWNRRA